MLPKSSDLESEQPLFFVQKTTAAPEDVDRSELKILASSIDRSLFTGKVIAVNTCEHPIFRSERRRVEERATPWTTYSSLGSADPDRWLVFGESGGIALRNLDHLLVNRSDSPYPREQPDMILLRAGTSVSQYSYGLWAVKVSCADEVCGGWSELNKRCAKDADPDILWTEYVTGLSLKTKSFEKGEVIAPSPYSVDAWELCNACFVSLHHWPAPERWTMLQALYFSHYFGDPTGMMLDILEP